jgi:simple sugar transport system ATP-binding protein
VSEAVPNAVIEVRDVWKRFGHVEALRGASLTVYEGEILALVGDNGAGKSTLMKVICGALEPDRGDLVLLGEPVRLLSVRHAQELGIETVYQDLALAPDLTIAENVFFGREIMKGGWRRSLGVLDRHRMAVQTEASLRNLGIDLPSMTNSVRDLSGGQRQAVAVARAVMWASRVILMDEPTAALGAKQTAIVYDTIRGASGRGVAAVVVSHDIPSMLKIAHRVAVMRHGRVVANLPASGLTLTDVVSLMLGGE